MKTVKNKALVLMAFFYFSSCSEFLDINTDPNSPTDAKVNLILPAALFSMANNMGNVTSGVSNATSTFVHQIVDNRVGGYSMNGGSFSGAWSGLYANSLNNFEVIIKKATASGDFRYAGIAKICKAYTFSMLVDMFGDIPFSEALNPSIRAPKFDEDSKIYDACLALLDEGKQDIEKSGGLSPTTDDIIFQGNIVRWRKFANTVKLKMLNQMRKVRDVSTEVNALLSSGDIISESADDFQLVYGSSSQPPNRNPGYLAEYANAGRESFVSPWFRGILIGINPNVLTGIIDPRLPYYFYNQKSNTNTEANANFQDGRFISRTFASLLGNFNVANVQTLHGLYPIGGRFDNGTGGVATGSSGSGAAPLRLLTFYARKFIEAEVELEINGSIAKSRAALSDGITAAFSKVNAIAAAVPTSIQTIPQIPSASITAYHDQILTLFDNADNTGKLELIMTQKWIASYGFGWDAYTDYRRTGFPRIFDPSNDGDSNTEAEFTYPFRLPYRDDDLNLNPNAPKQPNVYSEKIFWHRF
jgi:hypothetical protein